MTFPIVGLDFRKYSDEELTAMLVEAVEASKHARKRGRVMGIVAAHRLKQMREQLNNRFIHVGVDTSRYVLLIGGRSSYPPCIS